LGKAVLSRKRSFELEPEAPQAAVQKLHAIDRIEGEGKGGLLQGSRVPESYKIGKSRLTQQGERKNVGKGPSTFAVKG